MRRSLALAPGNGIGWQRLATIRSLLGDAPAGVAGAVALSLRTSPWNEILLIPRLGLALSVWESLDAATRADLRHQVLRASLENATGLAQLALIGPRSDARLRTLMAGDPGALERYDAARRPFFFGSSG